MARLTARFWGVRGSLATPGTDTTRYGGNTSCVEVIADGERLIFDMGSGLRGLGQSLGGIAGARATFFLSHYHWDHIQGLPFFAPAFHPGSELTVHGATRHGKSVREILSGLMVTPYFPISLGEMQAKLHFRSIENGSQIKLGEATVTARELNHPGGSLGYRVDLGGASVVYATDFEHGTASDDVLVELARGADLLIYDATYTDDEYERARGWGHSTWQVAVRLAQTAGAKRLVLFHHDPSHDDAQVDAILLRARKLFPATDAAQEGKAYDLPEKAVRKLPAKKRPAAKRTPRATAARRTTKPRSSK